MDSAVISEMPLTLRRCARLAWKTARHIVKDHRSFIDSLDGYLYRQSHTSPVAQPTPLPPPDSLPSIVPLNVRVDPALSDKPHLNVLIPGMAIRAMSGGPNTAINLTYRLAHSGFPVRYISTDIPHEQDESLLWHHFTALTGIEERLRNVTIVSGSDRREPLSLGENDVFFGTAWWTVQMISRILPLTRPHRFIYMVQEFEPGLYPWSSEHALALETYSMDFHAIVNESVLLEYLHQQQIGRFASKQFLNDCTVVEPAVDPRHFYPDLQDSASRKRQLLFYARPFAPRNLYELGIVALHDAVAHGILDAAGWDLWFIGEALPPLDLGKGVVIRSQPWMGYAEYARLLRNSDVGLSLMLSPHTSYPPLEMAASGMIVITNTFATKTADRLLGISQNILPVLPEVGSIISGLSAAAVRVQDLDGRRANSNVQAPKDWSSAFAPALDSLSTLLQGYLRA